MNLYSLLQSEGINLDEVSAPRSSVADSEPMRFAAPSDFDRLFVEAGSAYDVDPSVLKAMAYAESGFDPDIISGKKRRSAGAIGLMQFMPKTAEEYGIDPLNPVQAVFGAAAYMRKSLDKFDGSYGKAVASYNHGSARDAYNHDDWYQRVPPETQGYLRKVFGALDQIGIEPAATPAPAEKVTDTGDETARLAARYKAPIPERTWGEVGRDAAVSAIKSAVGLPQSIAGIADIPTFGYAGKALEAAGYRPADAQKILDDLYSDTTKARKQQVNAADGFIDTTRQLIENPSVIAITAAESAGSMLGGAGVARGLLAKAPMVAPWLAGAIGEGAVGAGSAASQIRESSADGTLTGEQVLSALWSGVGTAAIGAAGGKLAKKMGVADIDTMLAQGTTKLAQSPAGFVKAVIGSGISESVFEELPQSVQEQMWQNYATGKPIMQGVGNAAAQGTVTGLAMGVGGGGFNAIASKQAPRVENKPTTPQVPPTTQTQTGQIPDENRTSEATQAVDNIAALLKQTEAQLDGTATQATPVQPGSQSADAGTAPVAQGPEGAQGGLGSTGETAVAGQSESAQSLKATSYAQRTATPTPLPGAVPSTTSADAGVRAMVEGIKQKRAQDAEETAQIQQMLAEDDAKAAADTFELGGNAEDNLSGQEGFKFSKATESPRTPASTSRQAITKAYGNLLHRLEANGLVSLTQTDEEAIAAAAQARVDKNGGDVEAIKKQLRASVLASQRAWHGTPHRGIEKFSTDKIGTGEGAQAYGWGLYYASRKAIAEHYRKILSGKDTPIWIDAKVNGQPAADAIEGFLDEQEFDKPWKRDDARQTIVSHLGFAISKVTSGKTPASSLSSILKAVKKTEDSSPVPGFKASATVAARFFESRNIDLPGVGQLYEVDIPNDSDMLLWDKPLSEQPEPAKVSAKTLRGDIAQDWLGDELERLNADWNELTGQELYKLVQRALVADALLPNAGSAAEQALLDGATDKATSLLLADDGIKGIKYLDGTSRNAGEGSFNYVVFSGDDVQIVDVKYSKDGNLEGFFDPATGKSFLIADNLTAESAPATLMHEVGIHMAADGKLEPLFTRAGNLLKMARGNAFIQRVQSRMDEAGETSNEEAAAYIVTEYEKDRTNAPASVGKWVKDFIADVRAWLFNNGVLLKADQLTVADIAAVARANASRMAKGDGQGDVRYSKSPNVYEWADRETAPVGAWVKADYKLADSQPVYQVRDMAIDDLYLPELTEKGALQPEKRGYVEGYAERTKAGEKAPAIDVIEMENGRMRVVDGHRRVLAAKAAGQTTIRALVSPMVDTEDGRVEATAENIRRSVRNNAQTPAAPAQQPKPSAWNWKDSTGRMQFAPGAWLYEKFSDKAGILLELAGMKSASPELKKQLRAMKLAVDKAQKTSALIAKETAKLSQDDRNMVSDIVEKTLKAGVVPPAHAIRLAALINQSMEEQTNELVSLGMLSQESADRWRGQYLPRYYDSKMGKKDPWATALANLTKRAKLMRGIKGKHLKGRGMFETVPVDVIPEWEALGWEVRDDSFDPAKDETVQMWRDFTEEERADMGEIKDAGFRFVMGYMATQKDVAMGRMFKAISDDAEMSSRTQTDKHPVRVPDTKVEGTGANVYGALAGRYVSKEVLDHLSSAEEAQSDALMAYRKAMSLWKEGKALALDTPIPTPSGWTTMGDIMEGDTIFDESGAQCQVTFATPVQLDRECFEVEFSDGEKIVADAEHLWFTVMHGRPGVRRTIDILATLKERTRGDNNHSIPVAGELQIPDAALPVPPYALGVWLGDGHSSRAEITSCERDHPAMVANLAASGMVAMAPKPDKRSTAINFTLQFDMTNRARKDGMQPTLRAMGLFGNKHIPAEYLRASQAQRRALLQGLMDTDGSITERGQCEFSTTVPALNDAMLELLRSLGYKPASCEFTTAAGTKAWRMKFQAYADKPVFLLPRKAVRMSVRPATKQRSGTRQIVAITPVPSVPVRCIQVSSESRLYLAGRGMIPTHNTVLNPVSHINNTVSNLTMAHIAGVGYHRVDKYASAVRDFAKNAPMLQEAEREGLFLGGFNQAELFDAMPDDLKALAKTQDGKGTKIADGLMQALSFGLRNPMGKAYEFEDSFFKYLIYRDARTRGMDAQDAVDYAQRYIFTYDDLPKTARKIRDFGIPFFAYTYKAVPALLESAMTHPHRMGLPAAMLYAATTLTYAIAAGGDDEPLDELVKKYVTDESFRDKVAEAKKFDQQHLPKWMQGYTSLATPRAIKVGHDANLDLPVFMDVSRLIPGGDVADVVPNHAGGIPFFQSLTPNHPILTLFTGIYVNTDLFNGKKITDKNDTTAESTEKRLAWVYRQLAPAISIGSYHWNRGLEMATNLSDGEIKWLPEVISERYTGNDSSGLPVQPKYAIPQTFGIKVRPIDQDKAEDILQSQDNKLIREITAEIRQITRLNGVGALSDKRSSKMIEYQQMKLDRIRDGMTVDGDKRD